MIKSDGVNCEKHPRRILDKRQNHLHLFLDHVLSYLVEDVPQRHGAVVRVQESGQRLYVGEVSHIPWSSEEKKQPCMWNTDQLQGRSRNEHLLQCGSNNVSFFGCLFGCSSTHVQQGKWSTKSRNFCQCLVFVLT